MLNHSSHNPASFLADSNACLKAKITTIAMHNGGSPVAEDIKIYFKLFVS